MTSPGARDTDSNADPRRPLQRRWTNPAILDPQRARRQIPPILPQRDAESHGEIRGAAAEIGGWQRRGATPPASPHAAAAHRLDAVEWIKGANEHGRGTVLGLRHRVHQIV